MFCQRGREFYSRSFILYLCVCQVPVGKLRATMVAVGTYNRTVRLFSRMCLYLSISRFPTQSPILSLTAVVLSLLKEGARSRCLLVLREEGACFAEHILCYFYSFFGLGVTFVALLPNACSHQTPQH